MEESKVIEIKDGVTDSEIKDIMLASTDINDWNARRELVKQHRNPNWIGTNLDRSGIIKLATLERPVPLQLNVPKEVVKPKIDTEALLERKSLGNPTLKTFYRRCRF